MDYEKFLLLLTGFVFGLLPRIAEGRDSEVRQKKRALTKLRRLLEDLFIQIEVLKAFREAGGLQTMSGLFDLDESWAWRIPVAPPTASSDFEKIIDEVLEWETIYGKYEISKQVINIKAQLEHTSNLYEILSNVAKSGAELPERPIAAYTSALAELKSTCSDLLRQVDTLRATPFRKAIAKWNLLRTKRSTHAA